MRRVYVLPVCARCGEGIVYDQNLGDENGGPVRLVFPAYTVEMELCPDCMAGLIKWMGRRSPNSYVGTLKGFEKLTYLPRQHVEPGRYLSPVKPPRFKP